MSAGPVVRASEPLKVGLVEALTAVVWTAPMPQALDAEKTGAKNVPLPVTVTP
jgi:hypothetical protein